MASPDGPGSTLVSPAEVLVSSPLLDPDGPDVEVVPVEVGAVLELEPVVPLGPVEVPLWPVEVPLGPVDVPVGPVVPVGPTCDPLVPAEDVLVGAVVVVAPDELVLLLDAEDDALPDGDTSAQAVPVHGSPEHDATRKLPAAAAKNPNVVVERNERNEAGVDIANSNQSVRHRGSATPQQADGSPGQAILR